MIDLNHFVLAFIISYDKIYTRRNYVYVYLDPRKPGSYDFGPYRFNFEPFYVGRGTGYRVRSHLNPGQIKRDTNLKKVNKIKKIFETGVPPSIIILDSKLNLLESEELEMETISIIGRGDLGNGPLTNLTDGGDGCCCVIQSLETRMKKSIALKGKKRKDFKLSEEGRLKKSRMMKDRMKTYKISEETKNKISKTNIGKPNSRSKNYIVVDPHGKTYKTNCLNDFAKKNNLTTSLLISVSKGIQTHHKQWKCYIENDDGTMVIPEKKPKKKRKFTENMRKACSENGKKRKGIPLSDEHKQKLKTTKKIYSEDSLKRMKEGALQKYKVIGPSNQIFFPHSLKDFCKENGLTYNYMIGLSTGRISSYKNWKCEKV